MLHSNGTTTRLEPIAAQQPPPRVLASLNLARALTAAGQFREALTLYKCDPLKPCALRNQCWKGYLRSADVHTWQ